MIRLILTCALVIPAAAVANPPENAIDAPEIAEELTEIAKRFLDAIGENDKVNADYLFQDNERFNMHFFPIARRGAPLSELTTGQRQLGYALLSAALSHQGNQKALSIMSLGDYLRERDEKPNEHRDSDRYYFTIFGKPEPEGTWGYRVEGFHLSINVTIIDGRWISATPSFWGVIPATIPDAPFEGLQVLKNETLLARQLANSLTDEQRKTGFGEIPEFLTHTVGGLTTGNYRKIQRGEPDGLAAADMNEEQRALLTRLVREHVMRIRHELAEQDLARIEKAGVENIHFAWAGGLQPGEPHHYFIQGPTFLIEYDNTQDEANHVHCIYRDFDNDFGDALLRHFNKYHRHQAPSE